MLALGMSTPAPASTPTVGGLVSIAPAAQATPSGLPPLDTSSATVVLALQNMVTAEDQSKEDEMSDILEDTKSECEKHGTVRLRMGAIRRPRPEPATRGPAAARPVGRGPSCATDHATPTLRVRSMMISPFNPLPAHPPSLQPKLAMLAGAEWTLRSRPTSHAPLSAVEPSPHALPSRDRPRLSHPRASLRLQVVDCLAPKPGAGGPEGSGIEAGAIALRVYVRFETKESAIACAGELHGKQFDGRAVRADFISEALFGALQTLPCFV